MAEFHFIDNPIVLGVLEAIFSITGENYNPPYDSSRQPSNAAARNNDDLLQYDLPGGTTAKPTSDPGSSKDMGAALNNLLGLVSPFLSAFGLILPIIGIIKAILEVLCALMNPWAARRAIKKLFKKWLPAFISLYPPLAGVIIIISTIKLILGIASFVITELLPTLMLFIANITNMIDAFGPNGNESQIESSKQKVNSLLVDLANRLGVLEIIKPIFELILLIIRAVMGFPCKGEDSEDSTCCDENVCPDIIKNPPEGRGLLVPTFFGDSPPYWSWKLIPFMGHHRMQELQQYLQDFPAQLNQQLDEPVSEASFAGSENDAATIKIKITGRRGGSVTAPVAKIQTDSSIISTNIVLLEYRGVVNYEIIPNYDQLVGRNIIGMACHPEIEQIKNSLESRVPDLDSPVVQTFPETADLKDVYDQMSDDFGDLLDRLGAAVNSATQKNPYYYSILDDNIDSRDDILDENYVLNGVQAEFIDNVLTVNGVPVVDIMYNAIQEEFQEDIDEIEKIVSDAAKLLVDFSNIMKQKLNGILSKATDRISSDFYVDKNIVKVGGSDKAVVTVIPKDFSGNTALARYLPDGVDISTEIFTDFGILQNKQRNNETGAITMDLIAASSGTANLTATVNDEILKDFDGENEFTKSIEVRFIADAILPKRRHGVKGGGKQKGLKIRDKEPGK